MVTTPRYGGDSLSDLLPSVLGALGVPGESDTVGLGLSGVRRICVLLVDGLGARQLAAHASAAPTLSSLTERVVTATFPSTTATSLASLGTGRTPGEHGIVGYLTAVPGFDRPMNPLHWRLHGQGPRVDLLAELVPEQFQPRDTVFERAAADGVSVTRIAPSYQRESGLTRAVLRGGDFSASVSAGDLVAETSRALRRGRRSLVYSYWSELDLTGHVRGPDSDAWRHELTQVDTIVAGILGELPSDAALIVTADHGMVQIGTRVDIDATPALTADVRMICGEPRARHVFADAGAAATVLDAWRETLGPDHLVVGRDDAVSRGWFGPSVRPDVAACIGDVLALALGDGALIRRGAEPNQSALPGHHGSLTDVEMTVPLLVARG
ncbi:alkaline phosphatase family protein [Rhodococcus sp. BP-149]|uniref:alkaline phosphatase family protein n=1 Tax=unclassified Rhodococcus (in: high G+C Gram-positive bacteria) TaxID=192944 RepID=UPI001D89955F|nr:MULTISPECIES: alkaline phosphatase family protein [unclassified Rhodococcus (in: high G+C Gram-positive bacteria)]MBY6687357.1 alkaline phosphatase family protein [Rhodococcus sp. BP-288]MBY6694220.1 alkaline phosphatase family protein [Rhodococcus sp. BP-188]MBY6697929.1 alkaline phosphatase family protein [Rhodococcus sp. BP-285]MBY6704149.1 alkaline phosphatase family protein [Rhodococcus sp. BP-283]MBY6712798.1 alkaline phosphatase family protein [Rhodococcus sp. BP-160]